MPLKTYDCTFVMPPNKTTTLQILVWSIEVLIFAGTSDVYLRCLLKNEVLICR